MMSGSPKNRPLRAFTWLLLLGAVAFAAGCSTANTTGGGGDVVVKHVDASGNSVPGWVAPTGGSHANSATMNYIANGGSSSCTECHGADLTGGISRVSCFGNTAGCHHGPIPNWITAAVHGATAKKAPGSSGFASCRICHGNDFSGGGADVSCFTCHGVSAPHAAKPWRGLSGSPSTHTTTDTANAPVCYQCHSYTGTANPNNPHVPPAPAASGTAPGCFNGTMCHNEAGHAVPFNTTTHFSVITSTFTANCGTCHAVTGTSPVSGAPLCTTCHIAGSPLTALNCTSCHALPPNGGAPAGAVYPNIAGAHSTHVALNSAGTPVSCSTCHNGLGTGTLNHYNRANARTGKDALRVPPGDAAFLTTYNAKTGASSFDNSAALNCSNVSCHGGQTSPNWQTGALDVNNQCTNCHASGTAQYNGFSSGEHPRHIGEFGLSAATCKLCHNTTSLAVNHFNSLGTPAMVGAPATIGGTGTFIPAGNYNPTNGSCSPSCHGNETW